MREKQVGGDHYARRSIQPWNVFRDWFGRLGYSDFLRGNIIKYLCRYRDKNGVEDLEKASHYLEELIRHEREGMQ